MRDVRWLRVASILSWVITTASAGCVVSDDLTDERRRDMGTVQVEDGGTTDQGPLIDPIEPGEIGAACDKDADCDKVGNPICWKRNIIQEPGLLATPGGYCTTTCMKDSDCAGQGVCSQIFPDGKRYCLASCVAAGVCRDKYACFVLGPTRGFCWPDSRLTCNPTVGDGTCTADFDGDGSPDPGGCIRRAFEDKGECRQVCTLGTSTCRFLANGKAQHCVYINAQISTTGQPTRDRYKGLACFEQRIVPPPAGPDEACNFFDECIDGYQCNLSKGGDQACKKLCQVGVSGACDPDIDKVCKDVFQAGLGNPGLCVAK